MVGKLVLEIDKPQFVVKLHEDALEVDLKKGVKKEFEDAIERIPAIRDFVGILFQTVVPLDVALKNIKSAGVDDKGRLRIVIPLRKDIIIPLETKESETLAEKMNELIPLAKQKEAELMEALKELEKRPRPKPSVQI